MKHNYDIKLADFIERPIEATYRGYQPCFLDVLHLASLFLSLGNIKKIVNAFCSLKDSRVADLPKELVMVVFYSMFILLTPLLFIPMGLLAWHWKYKPSKLKPRMDKMRSYIEGDL